MQAPTQSKTILITGASSGIGRETARYFAQQGWNVAATMRTPAKGKDLLTMKNVAVLPLDVLDVASINAAIKATLDQFGVSTSSSTMRGMPWRVPLKPSARNALKSSLPPMYSG